MNPWSVKVYDEDYITIVYVKLRVEPYLNGFEQNYRRLILGVG